MATKIRLKKSGATGNTPSVGELEFGELALNYADGILYYKDAANTIQQISGAVSNTFDTISANGTLLIPDSNADILSINSGDGIDVIGDGLNDTITINVRFNDTVTSNNLTEAATANAVKTAYDFASSAANTVAVSQNSGSTLSAKQLNFVNTANVTILVTDSGDGNANIEFEVAAGGGGTLSNIAISSNGTFAVNANAFNFINTSTISVTVDPGVDGNANLSFSYTGGAGSLINSDVFAGTGACTTFTLTNASETNKTFIYIDGVSQKPGVDYQVSFKTLTFNVAPANATSIEVRTITDISVTNVSSILADEFLGDGACTQYTLSSSVLSTNSVFVFVDGVTQVPNTDYTVSANVITFTNPPESNGVISIRSLSGVQFVDYYGNIANGNNVLRVSESKLEFYSNGFSTPSDSISKTYLLRGITTNNTESEIFLSDGNRIEVPANTTIFYTADIVARRTDATDESAGYQLKGVVDNFSGTVADVGSLYELVVAEDDAVWTVDARADDTNNSINIYVTGEDSKTIRWTALVKTVEVAQ